MTLGKNVYTCIYVYMYIYIYTHVVLGGLSGNMIGAQKPKKEKRMPLNNLASRDPCSSGRAAAPPRG